MRWLLASMLLATGTATAEPDPFAIPPSAEVGDPFARPPSTEPKPVAIDAAPLLVRSTPRKRESWVEASKLLATAGGAVWLTTYAVTSAAEQRYIDARARLEAGDRSAQRDSIEALQLAKNMTWVFWGGAALLGAAAYTYLAAPEDWVRITPAVSSESAGLSMSGSF